MITLDLTGMTDTEKVEALTAELNKVLDDGTKQWVKHKVLSESFQALQQGYVDLVAKYRELESAKDKLETMLVEKESIIEDLNNEIWERNSRD